MTFLPLFLEKCEDMNYDYCFVLFLKMLLNEKTMNLINESTLVIYKKNTHDDCNEEDSCDFSHF